MILAISGHEPRCASRPRSTKSSNGSCCMTTTLTENRYKSKRYAVRPRFGQRLPMPTMRRKDSQATLLKLFLKRVDEELDRRGLSRNALSKRVGGPPQSTFNEVMNGADPHLSTIGQIATALGIQPCELLQEIHVRKTRQKVEKINPYPPMLKRETSGNIQVSSDRKKRRA